VIGLYRVGDLKQLPLGGLGHRERAVSLEFHLGCIDRNADGVGEAALAGPRGIYFLARCCFMIASRSEIRDFMLRI
jgi:hypothetical protein